MNPESRDPRLFGLVGRLEQARHRYTQRAVLNAGLTGLTAVLLSFCVLQLLYALRAVDVPPPEHVLLALAIGAGATLAVAAFAARRRPSIATLARAAERRFAMRESLSTALEVALIDAPHYGAIGAALLRRAESHAGEIDVRTLVPLTLPRMALGVPVLLLLAVVFATALPAPVLRDKLGALRTARSADAAMTEQQRAQDAADVAAVAAVLRRDGRERGDVELLALAQEVTDLGRRFAADPAMGRETLAENVERLLGATRDAYGRGADVAAAAQSVARLRGPAPPAGAERSRPVVSVVGNAPAAAGADPAVDRPQVTRDEPQRTAAALPPPTRALPGTRGPGGQRESEAPAADPQDKQADYRDAAPEAGEGGGGEVFGGAGGGAPGDYAGFGTRALVGEALKRLGIAAGGELLLQNPEGEGGRRTQLGLLPDATAGVVGAPGQPPLAGAWRATAEHEVTRTALPVTARDMVGRYFQGIAAEAAR